MTDRIHPMHEAHYPHPNPPSVPPLHGGTPATPMPEKAIRKEQEVGLISQYEHAQTKQKNDHIYAAPPPVYQTYGGAGGQNQSYGLPVAAGGRRRRRQRSRCCCCLISFVVTLGALILIAGIAALVVYLVVRPVKEPKYEIKGVEVKEFNMTNGGANVYTEMNLTVEARNGNKKIGIDYNEIQVKVFYMEEEIGEGSIPGFYQGHKDTTLLTIPIQGQGISLASAAATSGAAAAQSDASMWLTAKGRAKARIKIGRWKSRRHTFHVVCSLHLTSSSPHPTILSTSCDLKKRKFFFLRALIFG